ncbi:MAG: SdrD B-like domain-containing protein, partial [bacterium]
GTRAGKAGQFHIEYRGSHLTTQARIYAGTDDYPGWPRDRDGLTAYVRYCPFNLVSLWTSASGSRGRSVESRDAPQLLSARYRVGTRITPKARPRIEFSVGGEGDREGTDGGLRDTEDRDLSLAAWYPMGPLMLGGSSRWGRSFNHLEDASGDIVEYGMSAGGAVRGVRAAVRWNRGREWVPESKSELKSSTFVGDLGWTLPSGKANVGLAVMGETYAQGAAGGSEWTLYTIRPRIDLCLFGSLVLYTESSLWIKDEDMRAERWRIGLTWSEAEVLPVPWSPVRGEVQGVVYLDSDLNGCQDPGERGIGGVSVSVDGDQELSALDGTFSWSGLAQGMHTLEVSPASLPPGLVCMHPFHQTIWVEPGEKVDMLIPLGQACSISGQIFLDEDYDAAWGKDEEGLNDVRMVLLRDDKKVAECLSDEKGAYRFDGIGPGRYEVKIADGWLPSGWTPTRPYEMTRDLAPGEEAQLAPYGVAPKWRPTVKTYDGNGGSDHLIERERPPQP